MKRITGLVSWRRSTLLLVLAAVLIGVYLGRERLVHSPAPKHLTARAARADLESVVLAMGTLQPIRQVDVGTRATGQVTSLKVKLGDHVRAGDLLAEIDPVLAESALQEAQAKLADLDAQKRSAAAKLRKSRLESERQHGLIKGAATSNRDLETADAQRQADEAGLASLDSQISQARSRITIETANVSYTKILAPIDGEVVAVLTQEGQTVVASQIVPVILKLAQLDRMIVKTQIGEADIDGVKVGQSASFVTMSDPTKRYYGTLRVVDVVPQSYSELGGSSSAGASQGKATGAGGAGAGTGPVYYNALFDVPNPDRILRVGKTVEVSILLEAAKGVLAIPTAALGELAADGRFKVQTLNADGKLQTRQIRAGVSNHALTEVLDGLKDGEEVVTEELTTERHVGQGGSP
jgi:macrolide-specific efflux system membrane fusion protein